jgi:hypothetical protein
MPLQSVLSMLRERAGLQPDDIATSGKIRRSACVEHYRSEQFTRLDA